MTIPGALKTVGLRPAGLAGLVLLCTVWADAVTAQVDSIRIGMLADGPWARNDEILELNRREIGDLLAGEFEVEFPATAQLQGEYTTESIESALDSLFRHPAIDIIVASGPISSHLACVRDQRPKPVIAPYVIDAGVQGIPMVNGTSGRDNLVYVAAPWSSARDINALYEIVPFHKLAVFTHYEIARAIPGLHDRLRREVADLDIQLQIVPAGHDIPKVMAALEPDVDAVYFTALLHLSPAELTALIDSVNARRLPSFSLFGEYHVKMGVLAGLLDDEFFERVARRVALIVQRLALGEAAASIPVAFNRNDHLIINAATVRAVGVSPPWSVLTEADVIREQRHEEVERLTLRRAMGDALARNRDLASLKRTVEAVAQDVNLAWSVLFPQIDATARGIWLGPGPGLLSPDKALTLGLHGRQAVLAEPAWANVTIQKDRRSALEADYRRLQLDVSLNVAQAYLNTLRATNTEKIQRENLRVTRSNLDLARVREALGTARAAEVLRWETQLAENRAAVIFANTERNLAELEVNRILNRPLETPFEQVPLSIVDKDLLTADSILFGYTSNRLDFKKLRTFMVEEALTNSPEIMALRAQIAAQERYVTSATWRFVLPELSLFGDVSWVVAESEPEFGPGSSRQGQWTLGFEASFPLMEGGGRVFERKRALRDLDALRERYVALSQRIEQRVRASLHRSGASHAAIGLARQAAGAADESLDLVTDAYSQGAASILDVLDAQNEALTKNLAVVDAEFAFLLDLMEVERASGKFYVFMTDEKRADFFRRLQRYFAQDEE